MDITNDVGCWCKHCGQELPPSHIGNCPNCGKIGKRCEVYSIVTIGMKPSGVALVSRAQSKKIEQALDASEIPLWHKIVESIKRNVVIDGFEIGFPSGIKVIFKVRKLDRE
jgi:predicted ATP-dependent serine protease